MTIVFRTDSSLQIGSGHVMRCLTFADELSLRGAEVIFACRKHVGHLIGLIEDKGYPVVHLQQPQAEYVTTPEDVAHAAWLGVSWQQDAADTIAALGEMPPEWLIIDHYAIDSRWEETLRPYVGKIMVIDDLADRFHDSDLLLDQNLYQEMERRYDNLVPGDCRQLLGPRYALLRPEFTAARKCLRHRSGEIKRVLVFFGGLDPTNETVKALQALASISDRELEIDVVVGGGNLYKDQIQNFCAVHDGFHYYCQVDNMAELMAFADLAIGAGGTATWERCVVGLPALVVSVAENQKDIASYADKVGVLSYLGESSKLIAGELLRSITGILSAEKLVSAMSKKALHLVDGDGARRVTDKMERQ